MKNVLIKSAIATAVVAATTATTIADTKVYGRLRMAVICTDNGTTDDCGLKSQSSRFGIKTSGKINDGLTAFGKYEFGTDPDEATFFKAEGGGGTNRLGYVGLKGGFGEVSIGTRWSPLYSYTVSPVDAPNAFGGTSGAHGYQTDFRNSDTVNYKNKFGPASVAVQLQMDDGDAGNDAVDEWTIGAGFKAGSVNLGVGYQDNDASHTIAAIHAGTKLGPIGAGLTYATRDNDASADVDSIMLQLAYGMGGGKNITLNYGQDDVDGGNTPNTLGLEYSHKLGAGFRWFAGYETSDPDTGADNVDKYGAGMRLDF